MKRRDFLKSSAAVASVAAMSSTLPARAAEEAKGPREFYELRQYRLRQGPMLKRFEEFYKDVAVPAWNRTGIKTVGVFDVMVGPDAPTKYVLLPFKSLEAIGEAREKFENDADVLKAEFTNVPPTDPAYVRKESSLMLAFTGMPKLEVPASKPRIFEMRTYEAHSRKANKKKVEMFNTGEIEIFRRTGLKPVFFAETMIGAKMPNLTYMLVFDDFAARDKNWTTFGGDPEWKKLSTTAGYTNPEILTNITNVLLRPTAYSQI